MWAGVSVCAANDCAGLRREGRVDKLGGGELYTPRFTTGSGCRRRRGRNDKAYHGDGVAVLLLAAHRCLFSFSFSACSLQQRRRLPFKHTSALTHPPAVKIIPRPSENIKNTVVGINVTASVGGTKGLFMRTRSRVTANAARAERSAVRHHAQSSARSTRTTPAACARSITTVQ